MEEIKGQTESKLVRLNPKILEDIKKIVVHENPKYSSSSHFIRCGAILLVDLEKLGLLENVRSTIRKYK